MGFTPPVGTELRVEFSLTSPSVRTVNACAAIRWPDIIKGPCWFVSDRRHRRRWPGVQTRPCSKRHNPQSFQLKWLLPKKLPRASGNSWIICKTLARTASTVSDLPPACNISMVERIVSRSSVSSAGTKSPGSSIRRELRDDPVQYRFFRCQTIALPQRIVRTWVASGLSLKDS